MSNMNLCNLSEIRRLMDQFGLAPKKGYGQNFLINPSIPEKIADACLTRSSFGNIISEEDAAVLEIGPGIGSMTLELADRFPSVVAVEIDAGLIPLLEFTLRECGNVKVIHEDFMKVDLRELIDEYFPGKKISVCANLPYYITTPIIMKLMEDIIPCPFESITVMVQTEVADRICAAPGSPEYGAVTASIAYHGEAKKLFGVSAGNFHPAPKVNSSVVKIDIYKEEKYPAFDRNIVFEVIKAAFAQRRKTLANSLAHTLASVPSMKSLPLSKAQIESIIVSLGHRPDIRGEKLGIADFRDIADEIYKAAAAT